MAPDSFARTIPITHVGDSKFESWYAQEERDSATRKQVARDAYAAGLGEQAAARGLEAALDARAALENIRLFAARNRHEAWAATVLRFCAEGGSAPSPLR